MAGGLWEHHLEDGLSCLWWEGHSEKVTSEPAVGGWFVFGRALQWDLFFCAEAELLKRLAWSCGDWKAWALGQCWVCLGAVPWASDQCCPVSVP